MSIKITLVCFDCGKKKEIIVNREPRFAFELVQIANEANMRGVFDTEHNRGLVFCNETCDENARTKKGTYRVRPRKHL